MSDFESRGSNSPSPGSVPGRRRTFLIVLILLLMVAAVGLALRLRPATTGLVPAATSSVAASPTASGPVSPVSPVSPVGPPATPTEPLSTGDRPPTFAVLVEEGQGAYDRHDFELARRYFDQALVLEPKSAVGYDGRGTVYAAMGNYEAALADYNMSLTLLPEYSKALYNRARVYHFVGRDTEALRDVRLAQQIAAEDFGYVGAGLEGLILYENGDYQAAWEAFDRAVNAISSKADALYYRGLASTRLGNFTNAIGDFQAAIAEVERYPLAYQALGYAQYEMKQLDDAYKSLQRSAELDDEDPATHAYLMLVHAASGDPDSAGLELTATVKRLPNLSLEQQVPLITFIRSELETVAKDHPDQAQAVQELLAEIPGNQPE